MFEPGDKIVSLNTTGNITKDKIYIVKRFIIDNRKKTFVVIDSDIYANAWYPAGIFISLLEFRKLKINKLKERIKNVVI